MRPPPASTYDAADPEGVMRVLVDRDLCEANQVCVRHAPGVFYVDDADRLHLLVETISDDARAQVEKAVRACPRQALSVIDD
jgi:ferredoxin